LQPLAERRKWSERRREIRKTCLDLDDRSAAMSGMRIGDFLECLEGLPVCDVVGFADTYGLDVRRLREQLSRWQRRGLVQRLAPGLYCPTHATGEVDLDPVVLASILVPDAVISMESALRIRGMSLSASRPELTCVTQGRPRAVETPVGVIRYRHMTPALWWGYEMMALPSGVGVRIATAEKALLDILHYEPYRSHGYLLDELGIEGYRLVDVESLREAAARVGSWPIRKSVYGIETLRRQEIESAFAAGTGPAPWVEAIEAMQRHLE
jgi:hypothetical protein